MIIKDEAGDWQELVGRGPCRFYALQRKRLTLISNGFVQRLRRSPPNVLQYLGVEDTCFLAVHLHDHLRVHRQLPARKIVIGIHAHRPQRAPGRSRHSGSLFATHRGGSNVEGGIVERNKGKRLYEGTNDSRWQNLVARSSRRTGVDSRRTIDRPTEFEFSCTTLEVATSMNFQRLTSR